VACSCSPCHAHPCPSTFRPSTRRLRSFTINFRWFHDLSLAIFSELCVYANGRAQDINIDSHRGGV
jgi:hypothetical protein